jgi:hypothetical protein
MAANYWKVVWRMDRGALRRPKSLLSDHLGRTVTLRMHPNSLTRLVPRSLANRSISNTPRTIELGQPITFPCAVFTFRRYPSLDTSHTVTRSTRGILCTSTNSLLSSSHRSSLYVAWFSPYPGHPVVCNHGEASKQAIWDTSHL